ncbi:hypothetical protein M422DRAFT_277378 [Sphaerobolus stellatus SS14]|uniref:Unplaced genomic scaffold SPHSTscaffold_1414, whole genome shotgun sequence n=1 Tax=Sphaerobolus stellatus (strain SS14) TaxID=990650 RepID=A0A0C9TK71_SPHS4|nr:hypothetical protein M422DRAFT_277378 [Sphaerobolus stellatus SS14]
MSKQRKTVERCGKGIATRMDGRKKAEGDARVDVCEGCRPVMHHTSATPLRSLSLHPSTLKDNPACPHTPCRDGVCIGLLTHTRKVTGDSFSLAQQLILYSTLKDNPARPHTPSPHIHAKSPATPSV